jgi:hypothetical protein
MESESGTLTERQNNTQLIEDIFECLHVFVLRHWVGRGKVGVVCVFVLNLPSSTSIQQPSLVLMHSEVCTEEMSSGKQSQT